MNPDVTLGPATRILTLSSFLTANVTSDNFNHDGRPDLVFIDAVVVA